ncbi:hypothetical protein [Streptomyces sp. NPDC046261]|uniref:hypothetical protein n=1 Tax=Streptomyces sp. NPDC046261 TaxID=3157200 RepID=UPI0033CF99F5
MVDTRSETLAQVMGSEGPRVQVRRPGGGREWEVPAQALRLATRQEREAAGLRVSPSASPRGCADCTALEAARREAAAGGDEKATADATVAVRDHFRSAHLLPSVRVS